MIKFLRNAILFGITLFAFGGLTAQVTIYAEDFEGATTATYSSTTTPQTIAGLTGWTYVGDGTFGAMNTTQVSNSGIHALCMYEGSGTSTPSNFVDLTYDMSAYSTADSIELQLHALHNNDEDHDNDRVWVRGSSSDPWIEVIDFDPIFTTSNDGEWLFFVIDVDSALSANSQSFTTTFQARFGQQDNSSWTGGDGIAYDDISLVTYEYGVNLSGQDFSCFNAEEAFVVANVVLGEAPFTYAWSTGATTDSIGGLGSGSYCVTVTDNNGDTTSGCFVISPTTPITVSTNIFQELICDYDITEVQTVGSGGEMYTTSYVMDTNSMNYMWDSSGSCTAVALGGGDVSTNLEIGFDFEFYGNTYSEFQIAGNGFIGFGGGLDNGCCTAEPLPDPSTAEPNNAIFAAWMDVDAVQEISYCTKGEAPFRRLVVNFIGLGDGTSDDNFSAQIVLHESSNCIEIHTDYVQYGGLYTSTDAVTQGIQNEGGTEATTYPGRNGEGFETDDSYVSFCPVDTNGLFYEWSNGYTGSYIYGLGEGTHTVTVSDAFGCSVIDTVEFEPASALQTNVTITDVSCFGLDDGSIDPGVTGAFGTIDYSWSTGDNTPILSDVGPGVYSATIEDAANCTIEVSNALVEEPLLLQGSVTNIEQPFCAEDSTGSATVVVGGGTEPYIVTWNPGNIIGLTANNLPAGSYQIVVNDANDCALFTSANIVAQNPSPSVDLGPNIYNQSTIPVTLDAGNQYFQEWSTGANTQTIQVTEPGFYWVEVSNVHGCLATDTIYVETWPTSVDEVEGTATFKLYPNPARDQLTLSLTGPTSIDAAEVSIVDAMGRVVISKELTAMQAGRAMTIDVSGLPSGVYSLSISLDDQQSILTFVKQ